VTDPVAGGVKDDAMCLCKRLDLFVLLEVGLAFILYVVVQCKHHLLGVVDPGGAHRHELLGDRPGVVVGHEAVGFDLYVVAAAHNLALWEANSMALHNLLGHGLRCCVLLDWDVGEGEGQLGVA
jgi:hypothetical protein